VGATGTSTAATARALSSSGAGAASKATSSRDGDDEKEQEEEGEEEEEAAVRDASARAPAAGHRPPGVLHTAAELPALPGMVVLPTAAGPAAAGAPGCQCAGARAVHWWEVEALAAAWLGQVARHLHLQGVVLRRQ